MNNQLYNETMEAFTKRINKYKKESMIADSLYWNTLKNKVTMLFEQEGEGMYKISSSLYPE